MLRNYSSVFVVRVDAMTNDATRNHMTPDGAARQALRVALAEVLVVADNWRYVHLEADGADVDVLVEWVQADLADELT